MSLARGVSASQAREYYYEKDPISAPLGNGENSEWFGSLKQHFGLQNKVNDEHFSALLAGLDPQTQAEIVKTGVNKERRAGVDLAFSAPKSVSIAALHLGDERIFGVHNEAVKTALSFVQDNFIYYREKINGKVQPVQSNNMIAGTFLHTISRANDPQLHTHAVILNVTKTHDGKFKAISNEQIFKYQTLLNNIYQNQIALKLQEIGYTIENYENKFEIKGISEDAIETFSKRSREIDALYETLKKRYPNHTEAQLRDIAVLQSRNNKDAEITAEDLRMKWESEYAKELINPVLHEEQPLYREKNIIEDAVNTIHKNESAFNRYSLLSVLLSQTKGEYSIDELQEEINKGIEDKKIIEIGKKNNEIIYSTEAMIKTESDIVLAVQNSIDQVQPLIDRDKIGQYLPDNLTAGQRQFVEYVLTSQNGINIIQGDAGTGKTYASKVIKDIIDKENLNQEIIGLGFSGKAAQELSDASGIAASTIASFLLTKKPVENAIILVDEASMVSSYDMLSIIKKAGRNNKIVFIGDTKQLQAIGAGKMFEELQKESIIKTIQMEEVLRQETKIMKNLVTKIKSYQDYQDKSALESLVELMDDEGIIDEIKSYSKDKDIDNLYLYEHIVDEYKNGGSDCLLLTPSRIEKDNLNDLIRKNIYDENQLGTSVTITTRESISASGFLVGAYKTDDIIVINRKEWKVNSIDIKNNTFELRSYNNKIKKDDILIANPSEISFIAYREKEKSFCLNEKVLFTKNDKSLGVQNGVSGVISQINQNGNFIIKVKEKEITVNPQKYSYFDYGYAQTIHKAQGQTAEKSILVHNGKGQLSTEAFYVAATRAKKEFKVITTDKANFKISIQHEQEKSSTREFVKS